MSKCSSISCECKKKFIWIIFYWSLELACRIFMYIEWDLFQFTDNDANDEYIYIILLVLSDYLSFIELSIPWIYKKFEECCIKKIKTQEEEKKEKLNKEEVEKDKKEEGENKKEKDKNEEEISSNFTQKIEYDNKYNKNILKLYLIPIIIGDFLSRSFIFISYKAVNLNDEEVTQKLVRDVLIFFDTIFRMFFCYLLNEKSPYSKKHKKCSLIFILIFLFILGGVDIIHFIFAGHYQHPDFIYFFLILFLRSISYPLIDTIVYNHMKNNAISPCDYMRRRACFESILLVIISAILVLCSIVHFSYDIFSYKFGIIAPLYILTSFGKSYLLLNIIYIYSSQSVSFLIISESLAGSIHEIINFIKGEENMEDITNIFLSISEIILTILLVLLTLIYVEIMKINILGLNEDTENELVKKCINEMNTSNLYSNEDDDELAKSYDDSKAVQPS